MPAGTVSMLVALPDGPVPRSPQDSPLSVAVATAAQAHAGVRRADQRPGGAVAVGFARACDAVACALALQRELTADARPASIAVHTGQGLDHCAELARIAWPGQVLLSQAPATLVADQLPPGADLADLGWHRLADLGPAEHVWQLRHPDLPAGFPPPRSLDAHPHNLPVQLTSFVRRDAELAELAALIDGARLVTLTGSGGCGKTRLALHAAAGRVGEQAAYGSRNWPLCVTPPRWRGRWPTRCGCGCGDPTAGPPSWPPRSAPANCCWYSTTASTSSAAAPR